MLKATILFLVIQQIIRIVDIKEHDEAVGKVPYQIFTNYISAVARNSSWDRRRYKDSSM